MCRNHYPAFHFKLVIWSSYVYLVHLFTILYCLILIMKVVLRALQEYPYHKVVACLAGKPLSVFVSLKLFYPSRLVLDKDYYGIYFFNMLFIFLSFSIVLSIS